jgi:hypothetical protein
MDAERARLRAESEAQQSILELRNELAFAGRRELQISDTGEIGFALFGKGGKCLFRFRALQSLVK